MFCQCWYNAGLHMEARQPGKSILDKRKTEQAAQLRHNSMLNAPAPLTDDSLTSSTQ